MNIDKMLHSYNYVRHQPATVTIKLFLPANEEIVVFFLLFCFCFIQQIVYDIAI